MTASIKTANLTTVQEASVRNELDAILASASFAGSKRCSDFLNFIVNRALAGDHEHLTERFLGVKLFGRPVDYETATDSVVRVRATDVRHRLAQHYGERTSAASVKIELMPGTYIPEFRWFVEEDQISGEAPLVPSNAAEHSPVPGDLVPDLPREATADGQHVRLPKFLRFATFGSIVAGLVILALTAQCFTLWQELRATRQVMYPWQNSAAVAGFWGAFLSDQKSTDLVLADASFSLVQGLANKSFGLGDYLSHGYINQLQDPDPRMATALGRISTWGLASPSEVEVAQRIMALDPARQKIHLSFARKYAPDLMARDNLILLGSRFSNPWAELFESRMNFILDPQHPGQVINRAPGKGEAAEYEYTSPGTFGYAVVAYLPTPDRNGSALLIQGSSGESTQAAGDFLLTESRMADFKKMLGVSKFPYFELLLKTSWVKGTPINSTIVAYRTYGNPN